MKDREAFLEDQIKDFNEKIAHFKGLELRWNEGKRAYDRSRGGPGVQVNASYNTGGGGRKRRNRQPQIDIRQFDVGLDLVKLPNEDKETLEETVNQPVIEIQPHFCNSHVNYIQLGFFFRQRHFFAFLSPC